MKKTILIGAICAFVVGFASAESNWHKVILASGEFSLVNQKIKNFNEDKKTINCHGIGLNGEYISAKKDSGFAFALKASSGLDWTDGITDENEFGIYANTFAGIGFAPIRDKTRLLTVTGGIGADFYNYQIDLKGNDCAVSGIDFLIGANVTYTIRFSNRFGIGFGLLGTFSVAGAEVVDFDVDDGPRGKKDDTETYSIGAGSFSILPTVGMTIYF